MRNKLITVLLVSVTAGAASAQVAGTSVSDTNALRSHPATTGEATSSGNLSNSVFDGPAIDESGSFGLEPMMDEPFDPSMRPRLSDAMVVGGGMGRSFVDPDGIQVQREILFHKLDLLLRAKIRSSPVYFGVDPEVKFVKHQVNQPGIPAPAGMSYRRGQQRFGFFAEVTPILQVAPTTSLDWGGGLGIRIYLGR
jgi:hypothetical protein